MWYSLCCDVLYYFKIYIPELFQLKINKNKLMIEPKRISKITHLSNKQNGTRRMDTLNRVASN